MLFQDYGTCNPEYFVVVAACSGTPSASLCPSGLGLHVDGDGLEHQPKLVGAVCVGLRHKGAARLAIRLVEELDRYVLLLLPPSIWHVRVTRRKCGTFVEAYFSTKAKVVFIPANRFIAMAKFPLIDLTKD